MTESESTNISYGYGCGPSSPEYVEQRLQEHREQWLRDYPGIPYGTCVCGCLNPTRLAPRTSARQRQLKGAPMRYFERHDLVKSVEPYKVEDRGYDTPCWVWQRGTRPSNGGHYGRLHRGGKYHMAHRYYYEQEYGPIPSGQVVHHLCVEAGAGTTLCVRPSHLESATDTDNIRRGKVAKLTYEQVEEVRHALAEGARKDDLAKYYEVSFSAIRHIAEKRTWQ